jgi:hypothetical protein
LNKANPPSNAPLLDYLTHEFVAHGYDLKWLHREVLSSRTYQLSSTANETNRLDERNFSRHVPRRLSAEVAYNAILQATAASRDASALAGDPARLATGPGLGRGSRGGYLLTVFGKPARNVNCDCQRSEDPSLLQTLYLRNDQELLGLIDRGDGWLREVSPQLRANKPSPSQPNVEPQLEREQLIRTAYLRTLSRQPTDEEARRALAYLSESPDAVAGMRDLVWALLNTKEFILNH